MLLAFRIQLQTLFVMLAVHSIMFTAVAAYAEQPSSMSSWRWGPLLPERRTAFGCCATNDSIVIIGGTFWTTTSAQEPKKVWLPNVYRLRRDSRKWEPLPDFPVPIEYALVVSLDDRVFSIGGQNADGVLAETYSFALDEPAARWQRGPDLPRPLSRLRGGVWGNFVVAVTDEYASPEFAASGRSPKVLMWDSADPRNGWIEKTEVPEATIGFRSAVIAGDKLYVFGGAEADSQKRLKLTDKVWSYDLAHDEWSACSRLPSPMRDATAVTVNGHYIWLVGGVEEAVDADSAPDAQPRIYLSTRCLVYDCAGDRFSATQPLRLAVADNGLAILGDELFVVGGEDSPYRTRTDLVQQCDVESLVNAMSQVDDPM